ncbi:MAG: hypothetical protein Q8P82_01550 [bacterium]|nr:hypothetical protein [bacterium]
MERYRNRWQTGTVSRDAIHVMVGDQQYLLKKIHRGAFAPGTVVKIVPPLHSFMGHWYIVRILSEADYQRFVPSDPPPREPANQVRF